VTRRPGSAATRTSPARSTRAHGSPSTGSSSTAGASAHPRLVAQAGEAGVTVLAGTDDRRHGRVAAEIRALADAGLRPHDALAAGSWAARSYLGLGGLRPGEPADAVVYATDPRTDLAQLAAPQAVVIRGRIAHRRT
jgi:imidazolonepropionase-like amidohydrolase